MTPRQQLEQWVGGTNIHNRERNECCPDFSCCNQKGHWPADRRQQFLDLYEAGGTEAVFPMLITSLTEIVKELDTKAADSKHV